MGATDFRGYWLKAVATNKIFPEKYMAEGTWNSTPNQREYIKAYRDDNTRDLTLVPAQGKKSVFQFSTRKNLRLKEKIELISFFTDAEYDHINRIVKLEYWDDENNVYKVGDFYRPNMPFKALRHTQTDIIYDSLTIDGIEI